MDSLHRVRSNRSWNSSFVTIVARTWHDESLWLIKSMFSPIVQLETLFSNFPLCKINLSHLDKYGKLCWPLPYEVVTGAGQSHHPLEIFEWAQLQGVLSLTLVALLTGSEWSKEKIKSPSNDNIVEEVCIEGNEYHRVSNTWNIRQIWDHYICKDQVDWMTKVAWPCLTSYWA